MASCRICGAPIVVGARGRPRVYCSTRCRRLQQFARVKTARREQPRKRRDQAAIRAYARQRYQANREKILKRLRDRPPEVREKARQRVREWHAARPGYALAWQRTHRDVTREAFKRWYVAHLEEARAQNREWSRDNRWYLDARFEREVINGLPDYIKEQRRALLRFKRWLKAKGLTWRAFNASLSQKSPPK